MKRSIFIALVAILLVGSGFALTQDSGYHPPPDTIDLSDQVVTLPLTYSDEQTKCIDPEGTKCLTAAICDQTQEIVILSGVNGSHNMAVWWDAKGEPVAHWDDYKPGEIANFRTETSTIAFKRGDGEYMPLHIYLELQTMWEDAMQADQLAYQAQHQQAGYQGGYDPGWDYIYELSIEQRYTLESYIDDRIEEALDELDDQ